MTVETCGALAMTAGLMAFLGSRSRRAAIPVYLLGCALIPFGLILYLACEHSLLPAFEDVILWAAAHYASVQYVSFGYWSDLQTFPLKYFFPVAAILAVMYGRNWRALYDNRNLQICFAFAVAGFVGCFPRPDVYHIAFNAPLAFPLFSLLVTNMLQRKLFVIRLSVVKLAVYMGPIIGLSVLGFLLKVQQTLYAPLVHTSRGSVSSPLPGFGEMIRRIETTPQGDAYFFYPSESTMVFLSGREDVSPIDYLVPHYTTAPQYRAVCLAIMQRASWIVIDRELSGPNYLKQAYPAMPEVEPRETKLFEEALNAGFEFVAIDGIFELRHRRADKANVGLCDSI